MHRHFSALPIIFSVILFVSECCLSLSAARDSPPCVVPVAMESTAEGVEVSVARVKVGHPDKYLRLALDLNSVGVTISSYTPWVWSDTYAMTGGGGIDVIELCRKRIRVPVSYDPRAAADLGCPSCDGTLGLGRFNPLWMAWKKATLFGGVLILNEEEGHGPVARLSKGSAKCALGYSGFCMTEARINDQTYHLDFSFRTPDTYVPPQVYEDYVGVKSVEKDPLSKWQDLKMWVGKNKVVIRPDHLMPTSKLGARKLLLKPNVADNTTIVLGSATWRSLRVLRDTETETVQVVSWNCNQKPTVVGGIFLIIAGLMLVRWKTTNDAIWDRNNWGLYPDRILISFCAVIMGLVTYFLSSVQEALENFPLFSIYAIVAIATLVAWIGGTLAIYYIDRTEWMGDVFLLPRGKRQRQRRPPTNNASKKLISALFAIHGFPAVWAPELRQTHPREGAILLRFSQRVAIIRSFAVETILLLVTIMLLSETREDTLASLFPFLFTMGLFFNILYWGWLSLYFTPHIFPWGLWMLWCAYYVGFVGVTAWITAVEITLPFFERFVLELIWPSGISTAMVYILVAYIAVRIGGEAIRDERNYLFQLGVRYVGPFRVVTPAVDSEGRTVSVAVSYPHTTISPEGDDSAIPYIVPIPLSESPPNTSWPNNNIRQRHTSQPE